MQRVCSLDVTYWDVGVFPNFLAQYRSFEDPGGFHRDSVNECFIGELGVIAEDVVQNGVFFVVDADNCAEGIPDVLLILFAVKAVDIRTFGGGQGRQLEKCLADGLPVLVRAAYELLGLKPAFLE